MASSRPSPVRWWHATLVAVAACASPSTAQAGCGDYVVVRDANGDVPATAPDHGTPVPCHGPNCHGAPARDPLAPAAPPAPQVSPKECAHLGGTADPGDARPAFPIPTSDACPSGPASAVFHPPRAG